jgi:hypothetical protein
LQELFDRPPPVQFYDDETKELRAELERRKAALAESRTLSRFQTGRWPDLRAEDYFTSKLHHLQRPGKVAKLLWLDAALLAQERKIDDALRSGRSVFSAGRATGDEPGMMAMLVRVACQHLAMTSIDRKGAHPPRAPALGAVRPPVTVTGGPGTSWPVPRPLGQLVGSVPQRPKGERLRAQDQLAKAWPTGRPDRSPGEETLARCAAGLPWQTAPAVAAQG